MSKIAGYQNEAGEKFSLEEFQSMSDEGVLETMKPEHRKFFIANPTMLKSFRAYVMGDNDEARKLSQESLNTQGAATSITGIADLMSTLAIDEPEKEEINAILAKLLDIIPVLEKLSKTKRNPPDTPERIAQSELFEEKGFDFHFTLEQFDALQKIMHDAHYFIVEKLEQAAQAKKDGMPWTEKMSSGIEEGKSRHDSFHIFEEEIARQFKEQYPLLVEIDEEHEETKHTFH